MMKALRITQWEGSHETHESRKLKFLPWVAAPNKHDGLGFSYLKAEPEQDRIEIWCAFKLMVDLCARAVREQRGWLMRSGKPLTAADCGMMTGFPGRIFEKAFLFCCRPEVGWVEEQEVPPETFELPLVAPRSPDHPASSANIPAESPDHPASSGKPLPDSGGILPTDRQTGRTGQTDRQTEDLNKKGEAALLNANVNAGKVQFAALTDRNSILLARKSDWTAEERSEHKKNARLLAELQKKQRGGDFSPVSTRLEGATA